MTVKIELSTLLSQAIGQPEVGAVNFKMLHGFLEKLLGQLSLSNVEVEVNEDGTDPDDKKAPDIKVNGSNKTEALSSFNGAVEKRVRGLEDRLHLLDSFSATEDILKWAKGREGSSGQITDIWNFMNMQKRIEASENGIKKISSVVDKILSQLKNVSDLQERMFKMEKKMDELGDLKKQLDTLSEKVKGLDDAQKIEDMMQKLDELKNSLESVALKKDLEILVQWPQLQSALESKSGPLLRSGKPKSNSFNLQADEASTVVQPTGSQVSSKHPSPEVIGTLGELGSLISAHQKLAEDVEELKRILEHKANKEDLENLPTGEIPDDLIEQLAELNGNVGELKIWKEDVDEDRMKINEIKKTTKDLELAVEILQNTMKHVVEEHARKQRHIDALYSQCSKLEETKLNKDEFMLELNKKAEKSDLDNLVGRQRFDANITRIDDLLKELVDKFRSNDENLNKMITKIISDLEEKIDRDELQILRDYIDSKLKALRARLREDPVMDDDPAAVFKKAMLQFNCLSCDRPVYFSSNGPVQNFSGIPAQKSGRPYTTYELEQLRMLQKGSLKPEVNDYSTFRSCGGSHTSSNPNRRISAKLNSFVSSYEEVPIPPPTVRSEVDLQGQDGKLYKGRVDKNEEFPDVNRRHQNGRVKPKSAHAGTRTVNSPSSSDTAFVPRRPKTAIHRSQTLEHTDRPQTARLRSPSPDLSSVSPGAEDQSMNITVEDFA